MIPNRQPGGKGIASFDAFLFPNDGLMQMSGFWTCNRTAKNIILVSNARGVENCLQSLILL